MTLLRRLAVTAGRLGAVAAVLAMSALAHAQCDLSANPVTLRIEGFGTAHFEEFEADQAGGRAELQGSVCIVGENGAWTVTADRATISGIRPGQQLNAVIEDASLLLDGWQVIAGRLESDGSTISLTDVVFTGRGVTGSAEHVRMGTQGDAPEASGVTVEGHSFRLSAERARVGDAEITLAAVEITTCTCPGEPFYTVTGATALLDLQSQSLVVEEGRLKVSGFGVGLGSRISLSGESLGNLRPPVALEYRPQDGTGLGVVAPGLELDDGLELELGVLGLDVDHPLRFYGLARYSSEDVSFTVGRARGGPRADVEVVERLGQGVTVAFAVNNRHDARNDYLHEGLLRFRVRPPGTPLGEGSVLSWNAEALAAASAQDVPAGAVVSPRLGARGGVSLRSSPAPGHRLVAEADGQYTIYPAYGSDQYGVSLRAGWEYRAGPARAAASLERRWTDSGSPFSVRLDRLEPASRVHASTDLAGPVGGGLSGRFGFSFAYDLLAWGSEPGGLERLGLDLGLAAELGAWTVGLDSQVELAGRLDPDPPGSRRGYWQVGVEARKGDLEATTRFRWSLRPEAPGPSSLVTSLALPLELEDVTMTPYLAVDLLPLIESGVPPRISGHGLEITWASCCGTIRVGYRQDDNAFETSFGLALER